MLLALLLALIFVAAVGVAACGDSSASGLGPYLGEWQRVEGGVPDPTITLTVARQDDGCSVTHADSKSGRSETVPATVGDGYLACTLPAAGSDVQLSLDENDQLIVDRVLGDGTLEPVWIYDRAASSSTGP